MQFNKSDIVKMGGTAIVTALIFLAINRPPAEESSSKTPYVFQIEASTSQRISWNWARKLDSEYRAFKPLMVNINGSVQPLRALVFNARQLDTIINHNLNPNGKDSTADDVFIYFGQQGTFDSGKYGVIHLIAVGGKYDASQRADTLMIRRSDTSSAKSASVYDKADPCPPNCPKNF
jgi:hypothetical protein